MSDGDGSQITLRVSGAGTTTVDTVGGAMRLSVSGTGKGTSLTIGVAGGDGRATINSLSAKSALGSIQGTAIDLRGAIDVKSLESLAVRTLAGAQVHAGWIGSLSAKRVSGSLLSADRMGKIGISGDVEASRIFVSPANDKLVALANVNVGGLLHNSTIFALGDIGTVSARRMVGANVTAGVRLSESSTSTRLVQPLPDARSGEKLFDFTGKYSIGHVKVSGYSDQRVAFSHSIIGAYKINDASLSGVDGGYSGGGEFGVASYYVGTVKRSFDAAHSYMNAQERPAAEFAARQISEPLHFDSGTGTYSSGSLTIGGVNGAAGSVMINSGSLIGSFNDLPTGGVQIGTIDNAGAARSVYLSYSGRYELRDSASKAIRSFPRLGDVVASVFAAAGTAIKIENTSGADTVDFRTTSVGSVVHLSASPLGRTYNQGVTHLSLGGGGIVTGGGGLTVGGGGLITGGGGLITGGGSSGGGTTQPRKQFTVPSFANLSKQIKSAGATVQVYTQKLLLVSGETFSVGKLIGIEKVGSIDLTQLFKFNATDVSGSADAAKAIAFAAADQLGSRRLPARWAASGESVTIYGLPDGGTAVINNLGRTALNARGDVAQMPRAGQLHRSLEEAGLDLST